MRKRFAIFASFALLMVIGIWLGPADAAYVQAEASISCCRIAATNQANNRIELYDPADADWNGADALKWAWKPNEALGYSPQEVSLWYGPTEAKLRGQVVVATAGRLATIAAYPSGTRIWAADVGSGSNPHSAELLPDGNIAVAASDGKWVRVYTSSQGANSATFAQYDLNFAHAVHWDADDELLWVIGHDSVNNEHILTALRVGGTPANPTLTEEPGRRSILPTPWGHDISAYYGDSNLLWVSTNLGAYLYDKTAKTFTPAPDGADREFVKAIGSLPSGQIVETKPDNTKTPPGACTTNGWCTDTVDFYAPSATRTVTGAAFYKARIWNNPVDARESLVRNLKLVQTYFTGAAQIGGSEPPDFFFVRPAHAGDSLALIHYIDPASGRTYVMVVNESMAETKTIELQFDPERNIRSIAEVSRVTGLETAITYNAKTGTLSAAFLPGESKLYALPSDFRYQIPKRLPAEPPEIGPYTNLALNKSVTASSDLGRSGWSKQAAVDGSRGSVAGSLGWTSYNDIKNNHTEWIQIDMGKSYRIDTVDLYPRADGSNIGLGYPKNFTIQVSEDGAVWTTVVTGHQETRPAGMLEYCFAPVQARFVKIEGTDLSQDPFGNYHMQFAEIEIYDRSSGPLSIRMTPPQLLVGKEGIVKVNSWLPDGTTSPIACDRLRFASSDPAVATVDEGCVVHGHAEGAADIAVQTTQSDGTVLNDWFEVAVTALPSPWKADFYGVSYGWVAAVQDGFEIHATGTGIEGAGDELVYLHRDITTTKPVVLSATVQDLYQTVSGESGQAGIMIRNGETSDEADSFVMLSVNPQGRIVLTARLNSGAVEKIEGDYTVFPVELKLEKKGNRFVGYYKKDGDWLPFNGNPGYSGISVNMDRSIQAGMAVFSSDALHDTYTRFSGIHFEGGNE